MVIYCQAIYVTLVLLSFLSIFFMPHLVNYFSFMDYGLSSLEQITMILHTWMNSFIILFLIWFVLCCTVKVLMIGYSNLVNFVNKFQKKRALILFLCYFLQLVWVKPGNLLVLMFYPSLVFITWKPMLWYPGKDGVFEICWHFLIEWCRIWTSSWYEFTLAYDFTRERTDLFNNFCLHP